MSVDRQRRPPGRPRNEEADREIIAATLRLVAEQGDERTSREAVAAADQGSLRAGLDTEMIVTMLFGAGIQRMLTGGDLSAQWPRRVVDAVWPLIAPAPAD